MQIIYLSLIHIFKGKYEVEAITAVDKLLTGYRCAIILKDVSIEKTEDNLISRININQLDTTITNFTCAGGCFLEYSNNSFEKLQSIITTKYQTISYYGIEADKIRNWIIDRGLRGIDRVVPVGKTSDFDLVWDGYDLVRTCLLYTSIKLWKYVKGIRTKYILKDGMTIFQKLEITVFLLPRDNTYLYRMLTKLLQKKV